MNGHKLEECQEEKDLGVLVSNNLKVGPEYNQAFQKANRMLGLLKRMIDKKTPRTQHRITRLIPGIQKLTYMECLDKLNLWTLAMAQISSKF